MQALMYVTGQELRKLFRGGKPKALLALGFLAGVLFVWFAASAGLNGSLPRTALALAIPVLLPLFMASLGSELMAAEFQEGSIKNMLRLPLSREMLYFGKMFAGWIVGALIVSSVIVPAALGGLWLQGIPSLPELGADVAEAAGAVVFCGLLLVLANCVSLWTGSAGLGLVASVLLWLAMGVAGLLEPSLRRLLVIDYADWLQPLLYSGDFGATVSMLLFITAYYIIGTILGLLAFQRKEM
ncbi:ABC transporter permease [Paenibacillus sp.]|uniref:ABC transporter permease n=1 Tax=Paenibacillus sp. TaxID=58172 RepID=UPI002D53BE40|nr:ABC transporter permease [Paenibacillus sp.]HZG58740.1 ABC transporter permease [Paenibacillus sp.]